MTASRHRAIAPLLLALLCAFGGEASAQQGDLLQRGFRSGDANGDRKISVAERTLREVILGTTSP